MVLDRIRTYGKGCSLCYILCSTVGCNYLQRNHLLSSDTNAQQCSSYGSGFVRSSNPHKCTDRYEGSVKLYSLWLNSSVRRVILERLDLLPESELLSLKIQDQH
ncbi:hypothetical protein POM88_045631 [Heracleum sosnowskyi]|uniref:Uncharacterized protein n=1 Tax=Heracleum sosnowskyi TaxID=360622 RepID=A0AAD8M6C2_9APIA|nr:hypothetical protein POM88_045631 [Heracleum sosnowskyi]